MTGVVATVVDAWAGVAGVKGVGLVLASWSSLGVGYCVGVGVIVVSYRWVATYLRFVLMGLGKWKKGVPTLKLKPKLTPAAPSVADVAEELVEHEKLQ